MEQLEQLEKNLISLAKVHYEAATKATQAAEDYETALEKVMVANPELRALQTSKTNATSAYKEAKDKYAAEKSNAVKTLLEVSDPEDIKAIDTFDYRMEKKAWFDEGDTRLIERIAQVRAFGLLQVNAKVMTAFIKANAVKAEDGYDLPHWLEQQYDNMLGVRGEIKPTISDPKITAKAKAIK